MVPRISRRVAVIGGGSGGVIAARFMKRAGHRPVLFEAGSSFGGVWADHPTNDVVYKNLQTNLPTVVMQSPDLDFPNGLPSYIDKPTLGAYIEDYANKFGVAPLAHFGACVTSVARSVSGADGGWEVRWTCSGVTYTEHFDAVVVANGHYEEPYIPQIPGQHEWLAADPSRSIVHSRSYDEPSAFRGRSVLVVGGRSSGVDIARSLRGVARWVYVLEKKCATAVSHEAEAVTHVPLGTRLCADGRLRVGETGGSKTDRVEPEPLPGPPVDAVVLATGYTYSFPFLDEHALGMRFVGRRAVTPLYLHMQHAVHPTLGFVGIHLAVPCPIPFFECQAAYLAEAWARPPVEELSTADERAQWVASRLARVEASGREQDLHYTSSHGTTAWQYMRELVRAVRETEPTQESVDEPCWMRRPDWEQRLTTVEAVYTDRGSRYPTLPWHDDAYRRCEYTVDWESGRWTVDCSRC